MPDDLSQFALDGNKAMIVGGRRKARNARVNPAELPFYLGPLPILFDDQRHLVRGELDRCRTIHNWLGHSAPGLGSRRYFAASPTRAIANLVAARAAAPSHQYRRPGRRPRAAVAATPRADPAPGFGGVASAPTTGLAGLAATAGRAKPSPFGLGPGSTRIGSKQHRTRVGVARDDKRGDGCAARRAGVAGNSQPAGGSAA
ncbi:uncharacterized protein AMSG_01734 [Thecamonas trahens ATCC 50062]|uniref:Uncharacterized protein n=1 Tax=Thecamonas trahens ATCC 50062 TaxID=461836 RepID=A0A0L0DT80_THETB|nr:hypothetical protein AMSG_01734 [Thecamonas trahens ATCC 50062]KNC55470.1 hypothetical protein AMSG_01734 [Thecamonas trahens ATCC 50062]|eukprot:XP_013761250.1 hypothetical protein AMSG_01734 [Thecamonas trahens ATCC 50062]